MEDFAKQVGARIARARHRKGWSSKDLARESGEPTSNVARWEAGESVPNCEGLARVARACGVTTDWLVGLVDHEVALPEGYWIVDMGLVQKLRAGQAKLDPEESFLGHPIAPDSVVCSSVEFGKIHQECLRLMKKGKKSRENQ